MKFTFLWFVVWVLHQQVICWVLYKEENHTDTFEKVDPWGCSNLTVAKYLVGSIDTEGRCIQLHGQEDCQGDSVKVGPNYSEYKNLQELGFENRTVSVGPCTTTVDLFSRPAYRGHRRRIQLFDFPDCVNLDETQKPVESIISRHGDCVILFQEYDCQGRSLWLNGDDNVDQQKFLSSHLDLVSSIDVCPPNERNGNSELPTPAYATTQTPLDQPIFGEYVREINSVLIRTPEVSHHFCELSKRCTQNRLLPCDQVKEADTCYCEITTGVVTCHSPGNYWSSKMFEDIVKEGKGDVYPIAEQYSGGGSSMGFSVVGRSAPTIDEDDDFDYFSSI